jgi:UDP-N-acetylglucosamine--N-acetylmuramyl-(pentapeptide) pyrophosphoryl-undecaprenol N-acetylglucosamine transferase
VDQQSTLKPLRVLVVGGGTGGHVYPALAIADAIRRRYTGVEIRFSGTERGLEARAVPQAGYPLDLIEVIGLKRGLHPDLFKFPLILLKAVFSSLIRVARFRPRVVICTGGYVCGPVGIAAWIWSCPLVLQEQNSLPGITNRVLSRVSRQVFLAYPEAVLRVGGRERIRVGNPTRPGLCRRDAGDSRRGFGLRPERPTLLVLGGSQGARGINLAVKEALETLMTKDLQVIWQSGKLQYEMATAAAQPWPGRVHVVPFIQNMAEAYSAADLVIARSGATTLSELNLLGVPAILVPFPTAAESHQERNAWTQVRSGAAKMIRESSLSGSRLTREISALIDHPEKLKEMAARSRSLAEPRAADRMRSAMEAAGLLHG